MSKSHHNSQLFLKHLLLRIFPEWLPEYKAIHGQLWGGEHRGKYLQTHLGPVVLLWLIRFSDIFQIENWLVNTCAGVFLLQLYRAISKGTYASGTKHMNNDGLEQAWSLSNQANLHQSIIPFPPHPHLASGTICSVRLNMYRAIVWRAIPNNSCIIYRLLLLTNYFDSSCSYIMT